MQHDTTTYNKAVQRYKFFLHNKCCTMLYEKLGSFDRALIRRTVKQKDGLETSGKKRQNQKEEFNKLDEFDLGIIR